MRVLVLLVLLCGWQQVVMAQERSVGRTVDTVIEDDIDGPSPAEQQQPVIPEPTVAPVKSRDGDSEFHRLNKKYSAVVQPIGLIVGPIPGIGASLGYYYEPDMLFEVDYTKGELDLYIIELYSTQMTARVKKFWGNSFYTNAGIGTRFVGGRDSIKDITGAGDVYVDINRKSLGLDFQLGNRWQYEHFSIGCDWLGVFVPISRISEETKIPFNADPGDRDKAESELESVKTSTPQFLRFYVGMSW